MVAEHFDRMSAWYWTWPATARRLFWACVGVAGDAAVKQVVGWQPSTAIGAFLQDTATGVWKLVGPVIAAL